MAAEWVLIVMLSADPRSGAVSQQTYTTKDRCEAAAGVVRQYFPMDWRKLIAVCVER